MEKVSTSRDIGGLGLINIKERIQAIQALEYLQANQQSPETDNVLFEVGLHQITDSGCQRSQRPSNKRNTFGRWHFSQCYLVFVDIIIHYCMTSQL